MVSSLNIAVVGSVNLDLVARVRAFPARGETVTDAVVSRHPGGKGANQALAARRLGAQVHLLACVGEDPAADEALAPLRKEGVNLSLCHRLPGQPTGLAMILVEPGGENQIVVAPGANAAFMPIHLSLPRVDAVIAQLEVPSNTLLRAGELHSGLFCLNAAPARPVPARLLDRTDLLVVNEHEERAMHEALRFFRGLLAVTYGGEGAALRQHGREIARARPPKVKVVDTTGAGDAFTAALACFLLAGQPPPTALYKACVAGALATTASGAQSAPSLEDIERY